MRKCILLYFLLIFHAYCYSQTISPNENTEVCPHADYSNANFAQPNVQSFTIDFGSAASNYTIIKTSTDPNKPVACKPLNDLPTSGTDKTAIVYIAFEDQNTKVASFTVRNGTGATKTFKFAYIRSLDEIKPILQYAPSIDLPLCTTGKIPYTVTSMAMYKKAGAAEVFGNAIPYYEYSVPEGWNVGGQTSTGPNNYIRGVPNADISYDAVHTGEIKIRATQRGYLCDATATPKEGPWVTIPFTRPGLKLTANGNTSLHITCGTTSAYTFTVENGNQSCLSYTWDLQSDNNNWLYNGNAAPRYISTTTNSIVLTTNTCNGTPTSVSVTPKINNTSLKPLSVPVTLGIPTFSISGKDVVCTTENYTIPGLPCNASVSWSIDKPTIASLTTNGNTATINYLYEGSIQLTATINGVCAAGPITVTKPVKIGSVPVPPSWIIQGITEGITFCIGTSFNCYSSASPYSATSWTVLGGTIASGQGTQYIYVNLDNEPGTFAVIADYYDICGNWQRAQISGQKISNGCTGGGVETRKETSGQQTKPETGTSITQLSVYPNPVSDIVNIQIPGNSDLSKLSITISDMQGRMIVKQKATSFRNEISLSKFAKGLYLVDIWEGNRKLMHRKIVKK